jgi:integrase
MSLYQRKAGGAWWVRIGVAGQKIRKSTGTSDRTLAEAFEQKERERAYAELKLGDRGAIPWQTVSEQWLNESTKRTKPKDEYMLAWFGGYLDNEPINSIDRETIDGLREDLAAEGCAPATVNRYMALLRAILRKCRDEWRYLEVIPKVPMHAKEDVEPRWLTRAEFERLKRELPPHQKLAAEFAVLTGLRMRAMLGLTWDRVDLRRRTAWVPSASMKGKATFGFPLSAAAVKVLKRCRAAAPKGTHVFQYEGAPIDDCNTAAFEKAAARAGIEGINWHTFRHTFASWAVQNGVTLHELMELGHWKSYAMVLKYAHLAPGHLSRAAELVSKRGTRRIAKRPKRRLSA